MQKCSCAGDTCFGMIQVEFWAAGCPGIFVTSIHPTCGTVISSLTGMNWDCIFRVKEMSRILLSHIVRDLAWHLWLFQIIDYLIMTYQSELPAASIFFFKFLFHSWTFKSSLKDPVSFERCDGTSFHTSFHGWICFSSFLLADPNISPLTPKQSESDRFKISPYYHITVMHGAVQLLLFCLHHHGMCALILHWVCMHSMRMSGYLENECSISLNRVKD